MLKRVLAYECDEIITRASKRRLGYQVCEETTSRTSKMKRKHGDYTVGWICALPLEMAAAQAMLDEIHDDLRTDPKDHNAYTFGKIGRHNIVIACLPFGVYGATSAVAVASQMQSSFPSIQFGLMVGIGGGVPSSINDIRLGDIVVSKPMRNSGGAVQYDYGKAVREGCIERTGALNKPPQALLTAVSKLDANHRMKGSRVPSFLANMIEKFAHMMPNFTHQGQQRDRLFEAQYDHVESEDTCDRCDTSKSVDRPPRDDIDPRIHYGLIASGNQVMRDGSTRDRLAQELNAICFEMEAAGLMDNFPCLVIRGISDYADSHKNKQWQEYAAATAAAYAKEILYVIPENIVETPIAISTLTTEELQEQYEAQLQFERRFLFRTELPPQILWEKPVVLNDARGRTYPFFLQMIDSIEFFTIFLEYKFKDLGLGKIKRGEWFLQGHPKGRILDLTKPWTSIIIPGQRLEMSMIFRRRNVSSTQCPHCHCENCGPAEQQVTCFKCELTYRRIEEIKEIGIEDGDSQLRLQQKLSKSSQRLPQPPDDEDDISLYMRVHIIDTRFRVLKAGGNLTAAVTLSLQDLEDAECLALFLAKDYGLSEEDCLAALTDHHVDFRAIRAGCERFLQHIELPNERKQGQVMSGPPTPRGNNQGQHNQHPQQQQQYNKQHIQGTQTNQALDVYLTIARDFRQAFGPELRLMNFDMQLMLLNALSTGDSNISSAF